MEFPLKDPENSTEHADVNAYAALLVGDRFIFIYPQHGKQHYVWLYVRESTGHRRIDSEVILAPLAANTPLQVRKISDDTAPEHGMIMLETQDCPYENFGYVAVVKSITSLASYHA